MGIKTTTILLLTLAILLSQEGVNSKKPRKRGGGKRKTIECRYPFGSSCLRKRPWAERCLSGMKVDLILMVERMDEWRFNMAKRFALSIIEDVAKAKTRNFKLAVFTYGQGDFGVFWPIPKQDLSVPDAVNHLQRMRVQQELPLTARAMRFAAKFPEPSANNQTTRVIVFLGSGRRTSEDEDLNVAINDLKKSRSHLLYINIGRGAERSFFRAIKGIAKVRRLTKRTQKFLWRYLVNVSETKE